MRGGDRIGAGRRHLPLSISLQCQMYVSNPLSLKSFHEALAGNVHECLLKPSIGKARGVFWRIGIGETCPAREGGLAESEVEVFLFICRVYTSPCSNFGMKL
jgi:hypothetical protein